jgi:hypothetical protein
VLQRGNRYLQSILRAFNNHYRELGGVDRTRASENPTISVSDGILQCYKKEAIPAINLACFQQLFQGTCSGARYERATHSRLGRITRLRPTLQNYPRPLAQRDFILGPALDCRPIRSHCHGVIIEAGKVLGKAISRAVPNVDAKGKVGLRLHGGESDSTRPHPALFIRHVVASRSLPRLL